MSEKKTLLLYQDYRQHLELMDGEDVKALMLALFDYNAGIEPHLEGMPLIAFSFIKNQMDRDFEKYEAMCEKNRRNGSNGGRPPKNNKTNKTELKEQETQITQSVFSVSNKNPTKAKKPDTDTDTDTDIKKNIKHICTSDDAKVLKSDKSSETLSVKQPEEPSDSSASQSTTLIEQRFLEFWSLYPNKKQKQRALKVYKRIKPTAELHKKMLAALRVQANSHAWKKDCGQYVPYPEKWLNAGSWEDVLNDADMHGHRSTSNRYESTEGYRDFSYKGE